MKIALKQLLYTSVISPMAVPRVFADGSNGFHMGQNWGMGHMGAPIMLIFGLLILFLIVIVIRRVLGSEPTQHSNNDTSSALQLLAERYAKGEIDKAEFNERKSELSS